MSTTLKEESSGLPTMTAQGQSPGLASDPPTILLFSVTPQVWMAGVDDTGGTTVDVSWIGVGVEELESNGNVISDEKF